MLNIPTPTNFWRLLILGFAVYVLMSAFFLILRIWIDIAILAMVEKR